MRIIRYNKLETTGVGRNTLKQLRKKHETPVREITTKYESCSLKIRNQDSLMPR